MILVIETATAACSVALFQGEQAIRSAHEVVGRGHAERLMPLVAGLLDGERPSCVAVDCGPGSFTGVRVGLAAARGLGLAWDIPVAGFSSLAAVAAADPTPEPCAVALMGGHGELFVASFSADRPRRQIGALRSLPVADAAAAVSEPRVIGSGAAALVAARGWGEAADALPEAAQWANIERAERELDPTPLYGRAPDARPTVGR